MGIFELLQSLRPQKVKRNPVVGQLDLPDSFQTRYIPKPQQASTGDTEMLPITTKTYLSPNQPAPRLPLGPLRITVDDPIPQARLKIQNRPLPMLNRDGGLLYGHRPDGSYGPITEPAPIDNFYVRPHSRPGPRVI